MTDTTLASLHSEWETLLRARLPVLKTVEAYRPDSSEGVTTPAVLLDMESFEEGSARVDDPLAWRVRWSFFCLLSNETPDPEIAAREFALTIAGIIRTVKHPFDNVGEHQSVDASPAAMKPGVAGYQCWVVSFEHEFFTSGERLVSGLADFELVVNTVDLTDDTPGLTSVDNVSLPQV